MKNRGARQLVFVCSGISDSGELISKMILAKTPDEAVCLFKQQNSVSAQITLGPFYKKMEQVLETTRSLQFAKGRFRQAIFNDWQVNAFALLDPADHAYLVFIKRVDNVQATPPKGNIIVPHSNLRFLDE